MRLLYVTCIQVVSLFSKIVMQEKTATYSVNLHVHAWIKTLCPLCAEETVVDWSCGVLE